MSIEIDVLNGNEAWPIAEPLFNAVWPPEVVAKLPWAGIVFEYPELRVLVQTYWGSRHACRHLPPRPQMEWTQNARRRYRRFITREDKRGKGYATIALSAAIQTLKDEGSTDFAMLFCEPCNAPFYVGRGWKPFEGEIYAEQPQGRVRFEAIAPYVFGARRGRARSTYADCRGDLCAAGDGGSQGLLIAFRS
jgi:GNAT superfamily N-acetyltransferase